MRCFAVLIYSAIILESKYGNFEQRTKKDNEASKIDNASNFSNWNNGLLQFFFIFSFHSYISDFQLPLACKSFVEAYAHEIMEKKLSKNLLLHLVNMCEFNMISQPTIFSTMATYKNIVAEGTRTT